MIVTVVLFNGDFLLIPLFNTKIKIDYLLLVLVCICLLTNKIKILYVLTFSVLHEMGHLFWLIIFEQKIYEINLTYYGIGIKFENRLSYYKEIIYLLSGPIINLIFVFFGVEADVNSAIFFINIMPIYPLDGGRILKSFLNSILKIGVSAKIYKIISFVNLVAIFTISFLLKNVSLMFICIYSFVYILNNSYD